MDKIKYNKNELIVFTDRYFNPRVTKVYDLDTKKEIQDIFELKINVTANSLPILEIKTYDGFNKDKNGLIKITRYYKHFKINAEKKGNWSI